MNSLLIVDDEADSRVALRRFAHRHDVVIDEAASADDALAHIERFGAPTAVLCDVRMPGTDGCDLAEQLRTHWPDTAVVMVSAVKDYRVAVRCLRIGVTDWVAKPFSRAHVQQAVERALFTHATRNSRLMFDHASTTSVDINLWASVDASLALLGENEAGREERIRRRARLAVNLALMLHLGEPDVTDCELAVILREMADVTRGDTQTSTAAAASVLQISNRRHAELLRKLGGRNTISGSADPSMLQVLADVTKAVVASRSTDSRFRSWGEALARVPALAGAARLLIAVGGGLRALGDDPERERCVSLGARIVEVACSYDHLAMTDQATPMSSDLATQLLSHSSSPDDTIVVGALQTLVSRPHEAEATTVRWLYEARQRLSEARRGGRRPAIRAAQAAYDELRSSIADQDQTIGGLTVGSHHRRGRFRTELLWIAFMAAFASGFLLGHIR